MRHQIPVARPVNREAHIQTRVIHELLVYNEAGLELDIQRNLLVLVVRQKVGPPRIINHPDAVKAVLGQYRRRFVEVVSLDFLRP